MFIIIRNKIKKNFVFQGIITDTDTTNRNYKILYKGSLHDKNNLEYSIDIYEGDLDENKVEDFLNSRVNRKAILKSVLIDKFYSSGESINDDCFKQSKIN